MFGGRVVAAGVAAGVLGLSGCSPDGGGGARAEAGTPPDASAARPAAPSPVPVTGPDQVLVTLVVTGGYAGVHQEVTLRGDATVRTSDRGERAIRPVRSAEFTELRTLLGDPALDDVSDVTRSREVADLFQYEVRFGGRTVRTDLSAQEPPLDRLVHALSAWLPGR